MGALEALIETPLRRKMASFAFAQFALQPADELPARSSERFAGFGRQIVQAVAVQ